MFFSALRAAGWILGVQGSSPKWATIAKRVMVDFPDDGKLRQSDRENSGYLPKVGHNCQTSDGKFQMNAKTWYASDERTYAF